MEFTTLAKFKTLMNAIRKENAGKEAFEILSTIGYFASDCIRIGMFSYLFSNLDQLNAAVKLLQRYSLVQSRVENEISIKRDTQSTIRKYHKDMKMDEMVLRNAIKVVTVSENPSDVCHAMSVFGFTKEYPALLEMSIESTSSIVTMLIEEQKGSEAFLLGSKVLDFLRYAPAENHPNVVRLQNLVGFSLTLENKHEEALEFLLSVYEKESTVSKKREINDTIKLIARTMMEKEFSFYLSLNTEARLRQIVFGSVPINETKDNSILMCWIEYADMLVTFDCPSKAFEIFRNVVKRRKEILDPSDDDICEAMESLARALGHTNQFHEALKVFQNVYDIRKKLLGEMNEKTIITKFHIGATFEYLDNHSTALTIFTELAEKCERSLGEKNTYSMAAIFKVGLHYFRLGCYEKAYKINRDLYQKYIDVLGQKNEKSFVWKRNIGDILWKQNKTKEALRTFQELWDEYKGVYDSYEDKMTELKIIINFMRHLDSKHSNSETIYSLSRAGNLQRIAAFIQSGAEIDGKDEDGKTPLHYAVEFGHMKIAKLLLQKGAKHDVNSKAGVIPLQLAKSFEMRKLLLTIKGLFEDAKTGKGDKVLQHISEETYIVNVKDKNGYTALHWASLDGRRAIVKLLLEFGADPTLVSDKCNSPLHIAASKGHGEIVELLLRSVGREKLHDFVNGKTETGGNTPLHVAAERGFTDTVKILLSHGAVCSIPNKQGKTPLELSKEWSCCNLLKLIDGLFQDGKNGNAEIICKLRDIDSSELIVVSKARDIEKRTLLQVAIDAKHTDLARKLLRVLKFNEEN